jgi:CRP-like cAMP-binding protein
MSTRLTAKLEKQGPLTDQDRQALEALIESRRTFAPDSELVTDGERPTHCHVLVSGQAFRHKTLADGRRQIMSFCAPGDIVDPHGLFFALDYSVASLTTCEVGLIPRPKLEALIASNSRVAHALWRFTLIEASISREWMFGIGRRSAYARIAHLLCEVYTQLGAAGLTQGARCPFPVTQTHLSDALGLSVVHTNRILQALRSDKLIEFRGRELVVLDWPGLMAAGEFDPAYLHLSRAG